MKKINKRKLIEEFRRLRENTSKLSPEEIRETRE